MMLFIKALTAELWMADLAVVCPMALRSAALLDLCGFQ